MILDFQDHMSTVFGFPLCSETKPDVSTIAGKLKLRCLILWVSIKIRLVVRGFGNDKQILDYPYGQYRRTAVGGL
jgi:hypothetical protein